MLDLASSEDRNMLLKMLLCDGICLNTASSGSLRRKYFRRNSPGGPRIASQTKCGVLGPSGLLRWKYFLLELPELAYAYAYAYA